MQLGGPGPRLTDRLLRDGYLAVSVAFLGLRLFGVPPWDQSVDAYAYWATRDGTFYDGSTAGVLGAYLYAPAFAQALAPVAALPWPPFVTLWTALNLAALWWLAGRWSLPLLLFPPIPFEIVSGNVHLLVAAAVAAGLRPSGGRAVVAVAWVLPLLTKVTAGVGLLWYAIRREWRPLAVATGATLGVAAASYALDPSAWRAWLDILANSSSTPATVGWTLPVPLLARLPVAVVIVLFAGRTGRAWLVPLAVVLALPVIWLNSLAVLAACVRLRPPWPQDRAETLRTRREPGSIPSAVGWPGPGG